MGQNFAYIRSLLRATGFSFIYIFDFPYTYTYVYLYTHHYMCTCVDLSCIRTGFSCLTCEISQIHLYNKPTRLVLQPTAEESVVPFPGPVTRFLHNFKVKFWWEITHASHVCIFAALIFLFSHRQFLNAESLFSMSPLRGAKNTVRGRQEDVMMDIQPKVGPAHGISGRLVLPYYRLPLVGMLQSGVRVRQFTSTQHRKQVTQSPVLSKPFNFLSLSWGTEHCNPTRCGLEKAATDICNLCGDTWDLIHLLGCVIDLMQSFSQK